MKTVEGRGDDKWDVYVCVFGLCFLPDSRMARALFR